MSNLIPSADVSVSIPPSSAGPAIEAFPCRKAEVGVLSVRRALPVRQRRTIGPWCFFDHFGPIEFIDGKPMDVAPHPHIGLQTVSWLFEGEVLHRDSLGSEALLHPGELNLMTAGAGIAHAEETPLEHSRRLHGVQLWIALPEIHRRTTPLFAHHTDILTNEIPGGRVTVIMGQVDGVHSPAKAFSTLIAFELVVNKSEKVHVPLDRSFEHGMVVVAGQADLEGQSLDPDTLYYLGVDRDELSLTSRGGARVMVVGGAPFGESIVMWWNFVARTNQEIQQAREDWAQHRRFGDVSAYRGPRLEAPPLEFRPKSG